MVSRNGSDYSTSIDTIIGEQIGRGTRFRSLEVTCDGDSSASWSARGSSGLNPSETSPLALYARLFGDGFQDPNVADFTPDPAVMVRHSVLSAVSEQRKKLLAERARYVRSAETMAAEAAALLDDREPGDLQFDEESGEGDSWAVERERDLALSAAARAAVELIDEALKRIEEGTYGTCVVSGKPIQKERLRAIPWAAERVEYKAGGLRRR